MKAVLKWLFASSVVGAMLCSGVARADKLADVKAQGKLVCGVMSNVPPFGFLDADTRQVTGYDVDFCKGVAKQLGVQPELKVISLDARIPELQQGRIDVLAAVLGYNAARAQQIAFTKTYFVSESVISVKTDSAYKTLGDLAGKRVSTIKSSSNIPFVQHALPTAQLISYDDAPSAFAALVQNKVDGFVLSESLMHRFIEKLGPQAKDISVLAPPVGGEDWGLGIKKDEPALLEAVNTALDNMEKSGESQQIFDRWLGDRSNLKMKRTFKTEAISG